MSEEDDVVYDRSRLPWLGEGYDLDVEIKIGVAWCHECKEMIGPDNLDDVGYEIALGEHQGHLVQVVDEWVEVEVIEE